MQETIVQRRVPPPSNIAAPPKETQAISPTYEGIPLEFIEYFNVDIRKLENRDKKQLSEIYDLLKKDGNSISDVLLTISRLDRKLGQPSYQETRYGRIWSWAKTNSRINELLKQKKAIEG